MNDAVSIPKVEIVGKARWEEVKRSLGIRNDLLLLNLLVDVGYGVLKRVQAGKKISTTDQNETEKSDVDYEDLIAEYVFNDLFIAEEDA